MIPGRYFIIFSFLILPCRTTVSIYTIFALRPSTIHTKVTVLEVTSWSNGKYVSEMPPQGLRYIHMPHHASTVDSISLHLDDQVAPDTPSSIGCYILFDFSYILIHIWIYQFNSVTINMILRISCYDQFYVCTQCKYARLYLFQHSFLLIASATILKIIARNPMQYFLQDQN